MDEDGIGIDHEGVQPAVVDDEDVDAVRAEPGGLEHRRGELLQGVFDIGIAQQGQGARGHGHGHAEQGADQEKAKNVH